MHAYVMLQVLGLSYSWTVEICDHTLLFPVCIKWYTKEEMCVYNHITVSIFGALFCKKKKKEKVSIICLYAECKGTLKAHPFIHLICLFYSNTFETWREALNKGPLVLRLWQVGEVAGRCTFLKVRDLSAFWTLEDKQEMAWHSERCVTKTDLGGECDSVVGERTEKEYDTGKTNCGAPKPQVHNCEWDLLMRAVTALLLWNKCSWSIVMLCLCVHVCVCLHT